MAGRKQYDNQTTIMATNRVDTIFEDMVPGGKITLPKGVITRIDLAVEEKVIINIAYMFYSLSKPSDFGATNGSLNFDIGVSSDTWITNVVRNIIQFGSATRFEYQEFKNAAPYVVPELYPSTQEKMLDTVKQLTLNSQCRLTLRITNNTDVDLNNIPFTFYFVGKKEITA